MRYAYPLLALALALPASLSAAPTPAKKAVAAKRQPYEGVWRNNKGTVEIETRACGRGGLCGRVVRASAEAEEAAGQSLKGVELFRDLERGQDGQWYGAVFVPDIGREVEGSIAQDGPNRLAASGCLFAGFGCKTQVWTRVR